MYQNVAYRSDQEQRIDAEQVTCELEEIKLFTCTRRSHCCTLWINEYVRMITEVTHTRYIITSYSRLILIVNDFLGNSSNIGTYSYKSLSRRIHTGICDQTENRVFITWRNKICTLRVNTNLEDQLIGDISVLQ